MTTDSPGKLIVIAGPSGVGKGTLVSELMKKLPELHLSISATTRQPRPHEEEGKHYFFMDGDARAVPGSFSAMERALLAEPQAQAVGVPPASGRSMRHDREELLRERGLVANLYALRGSFVIRCQEIGVRIPLRLEGDDGLVGALVKWDLNPSQPMNDLLIAPCADAGFIFESFTISRFADVRAYWRRMVRYGRRGYEFKLLGPRLQAGGIAAMPKDICEIYVDSDRLSLTWNGVYTLTNWFALREMRAIGRR